jgi:hypothetical protein
MTIFKNMVYILLKINKYLPKRNFLPTPNNIRPTESHTKAARPTTMGCGTFFDRYIQLL